jgi:hypothetical protein
VAQQDAALTLGIALGARYSIPAHNQRAHFEWSPGRKIDPYGPCRWNINANTFWDMDAFRNNITQGEDDMAALDKPIRWFDTREGKYGPLLGGKEVAIALPAAFAGAKDVQINATVTEPAGAGYLTVWPDGSRPVVSNLNYAAGQTVANGTLVKVGADGKVRFWLLTSGHLIVDIQGVRE